MSDHLHAAAWLDIGDTVVVRLDAPGNVMLLDDQAYSRYLEGREFRYHGGWVSQPQISLWVPRQGLWHVVVDLGGGEGKIAASVQVMRG